VIGVALEAALCPRCSVAPTKLVRRAESWLDDVPGVYSVCACPICGLWVTTPRLQLLHLAYPDAYFRVRLDDSAWPQAREHRGDLLDVGCGVGDSLVQARSQGWRCVGIEISENAAAIARARGFEVIVGDATDVEYPPILFDFVRCWHTLEHVKDPVKLLGKLRDAVRLDGVVQLLLPNPRSLTSILFRRYWYHLDVPRHLHHLRPGDVAALAQKVGLHIRRIRQTASPSGLLGSIDIVVAQTTGYADFRLRSKPRLRSFTRIVTWPAARVGLADVVEYELTRSPGGTSSHG